MFQIWKWIVLGNRWNLIPLVLPAEFNLKYTASEPVDNLNETLFSYVLMKEASGPQKLLVDLKTFCGMTLPNTVL